MKIICETVINVETVGHAIELWDDDSTALVRLYLNRDEKIYQPVIISGTPRELRKLGRSILKGLTRERKKID
jgi:hypothetical protein